MIKIITAIFLVSVYSASFAQEMQSLTLKQAQNYALENNYDKVNADNDLLIAKKKIWETTGIGLPQINAEAKFQNFIDIPVSLVPANAFDPNAPRPVLLTAITTILGLIPLATGLNINFFTLFSEFNAHIYFGGDNVIFWGPLAWTVIYGLFIATFLTLIVVPVLYLLVEKFKFRIGKA